MKIAIIGAGAVGSSCAYFLSKESAVKLTVFDEGVGQATKAAAGIISPWFSKRRNKAWYRLARLGADFYPQLVADLQEAGYSAEFYQQTGVFLLKKDEVKLEELYELAMSRRQESPLIGDLQIISKDQANQYFPNLEGFEKLLYASGGAKVDGKLMTETLIKASGARLVRKKVSLLAREKGYDIDGELFDKVILAAGAWLGQLLAPLGYKSDIRPQKGQLRDYIFTDLVDETANYPVVMPEGELDIIPFSAGQISMGASHENDKGFDLTVDEVILDDLQAEAQAYFPKWQSAQQVSERVGTRAYTSDFSPFFGQVPGLDGVYAASGLGSTGLTIGPLLGQQLAKLALDKPLDLALEDYPIARYIIGEEGI